MKKIEIISLNKSHDNPEEFINNIVNLTFSKKINSGENLKDDLLKRNKQDLLVLKNKIIDLQLNMNNEDLLSENQFLDFIDIELMLNKIINKFDEEIYTNIIIRLKKLEEDLNIKILPTNNTLSNIIEMKHQGILEHVTCSYLIKGASRSLLSQITRHRLFSFISASQHYMDYSDFGDFVIPVEIETLGTEAVKDYLESNKRSLEEYKRLISTGILPEVARQVLPNSMRNNLIITGNLREWLNFMNLRLCNRNTSEIQYIAKLIKDDLSKYVPIISKYMAPDCVTTGKCTQKHMFCGEYYTDLSCDNKYKILRKDM